MRKPYLAVAFIVGCATGPVMQEVVKERPAVAQAPAGARKWEQFCTYRINSYDALADKANPDLKEQGLQGWELVSFSITNPNPTIAYYCFKRPLP
jgi:hypothetical protein